MDHALAALLTLDALFRLIKPVQVQLELDIELAACSQKFAEVAKLSTELTTVSAELVDNAVYAA